MPDPVTPAVSVPPALLLIAHGTRAPEGAQEMDALMAQVQQRHGGLVTHAWLEDFASPDAATAAQSLVAQGAQQIVALPFLNFVAYHARTDVPQAVKAARAVAPEAEFTIGEVLGHHPWLLDLAERRVRGARAAADLDDVPGEDEVLVVAASGSSNAEANSDVAKAARLLAERTGHRWVDLAFAGVTWPTATDALTRAARAGAVRATLFSWSLLAGLLEQKIWDQADEVTSATGLSVINAGRFGPDPTVADVVMERFTQAASAAYPFD